MTTQQIDPGYGYRLLRPAEVIQEGDEYLSHNRITWIKGATIGAKAGEFKYAVTRRRIDPGEGWEIVPEDGRLIDGDECFDRDCEHWERIVGSNIKKGVTPKQMAEPNYIYSPCRRRKQPTAKPMDRKFDLELAMKNGGKCVTRDGRPARIICTDRKGDADSQLLALITDDNGVEFIKNYWITGEWSPRKQPMPEDLLNLPQKHTHTVTLYRWKDGTVTTSRNGVDSFMSASKKVTAEFEEGENL